MKMNTIEARVTDFNIGEGILETDHGQLQTVWITLDIDGESVTAYRTFKPENVEKVQGQWADLIDVLAEFVVEDKGTTKTGEKKFKVLDYPGGYDSKCEVISGHPAGTGSGAGSASTGDAGDEPHERKSEVVREVPLRSLPDTTPRPTLSSTDKDSQIARAVAYKALVEFSSDLTDPDARRTWVHSLLEEETAYLLGGAG